MYGQLPESVLSAEQLMQSGMPEPVAKVAAGEMRAVLSDWGLDASDAKLAVQAISAFDPKADAKTLQASAEKMLADAFGEKASDAAAAARQLAQRDPRVAYWLARSGQGNNPELVVLLAKAAMRGRV